MPDETPDPAALEVSGLKLDVRTHLGWRPILHDVSLTVREHEVVGLVGESGSGKSMTCLTVLGLHQAGSVRVRGGSARVAGREMLGTTDREANAVRGRTAAMVFQEPMSSLNPALTIGRQLREHAQFHEKLSRKQAEDRAAALLQEVGVPNPRVRMRMYPHEFSGGMCQRVMLAMALMCRPKLLIADEPTTALDVTVAAQILDLMKRLQAEHGMAILLVTHDLGVVADICDRVAVMYDGEVVEDATTQQFFARPAHPYSAELLGALHELRGRPHRGSKAGRASNLLVVPTGAASECRYAPRCRYVEEVCLIRHPEMSKQGDRRVRCARAGELDLSGSDLA